MINSFVQQSPKYGAGGGQQNDRYFPADDVRGAGATERRAAHHTRLLLGPSKGATNPPAMQAAPAKRPPAHCLWDHGADGRLPRDCPRKALSVDADSVSQRRIAWGQCPSRSGYCVPSRSTSPAQVRHPSLPIKCASINGCVSGTWWTSIVPSDGQWSCDHSWMPWRLEVPMAPLDPSSSTLTILLVSCSFLMEQLEKMISRPVVL